VLHIHVVGANSMQPSFDVIGLTTWGFDRKMMLRHTADGGLVGGRPMENPLKISQNERSSYELERIHLQLDMHIYIYLNIDWTMIATRDLVILPAIRHHCARPKGREAKCAIGRPLAAP
jgi:hypothetical protein